MGFGLLFFGYFATFLMSFNTYGAIFSLIGCYVIFNALQRLSEYKRNILRCLFPLGAMFLCSLCDSATLICELMGITSPFSGQIFSTAISFASLASSLAFHILLFSSIASLGKDTDLPDVISLARTNSFAVSVYFLLNVVLFILNSYSASDLSLLMALTLLLRVAYPLSGLALIYKCFRKICSPEDLTMPTKPSRFRFINEIRARNEKKAEETRAAREAMLKKKSDTAKSPKKK